MTFIQTVQVYHLRCNKTFLSDPSPIIFSPQLAVLVAHLCAHLCASSTPLGLAGPPATDFIMYVWRQTRLCRGDYKEDTRYKLEADDSLSRFVSLCLSCRISTFLLVDVAEVHHPILCIFRGSPTLSLYFQRIIIQYSIFSEDHQLCLCILRRT